MGAGACRPRSWERGNTIVSEPLKSNPAGSNPPGKSRAAGRYAARRARPSPSLFLRRNQPPPSAHFPAGKGPGADTGEKAAARRRVGRGGTRAWWHTGARPAWAFACSCCRSLLALVPRGAAPLGAVAGLCAAGVIAADLPAALAAEPLVDGVVGAAASSGGDLRAAAAVGWAVGAVGDRAGAQPDEGNTARRAVRGRDRAGRRRALDRRSAAAGASDDRRDRARPCRGVVRFRHERRVSAAMSPCGPSRRRG